MSTTSMPIASPDTAAGLVAELRKLIDGARQRAAAAVNAELSLLYWQVGLRIHREVLGSERAGYGEQIVATLGLQLTSAYGRGWHAICACASASPKPTPSQRLCTRCVPN